MSEAVRIKFAAGESISTAAVRLCEAAAEHGEAIGSFNEIELHAAAGYLPGGIEAYYREECARRHEAWMKSPAGIAAQREAEERRQTLQVEHDQLMRKMPRLNLSDMHAVLDWLCAIQEATDHAGVIVRRQMIIAAFEKAGYRANANTGADYRHGDRENMFRYLVGQALAGLKEGPSIHPIIHKFADEWRRRFPRERATP